MKRIIAIVLAMIMCLALCSCGTSTPEPVPSEADLKTQAEQEAFDAAVAFIEEGKYDEAIEALSGIESYKKIADKLDEVKALKADAEKAATEAADAARPREKIEITLDNWQDYFVLVQIPEFDAFGDLALIRHLLVPKEEYADIIAYQDAFTIDIAYRGGGPYSSVVIQDDGTIVYGEASHGGWWSYDDVLSLTNETLEIITDYVYRGGEIPEEGIICAIKISHSNGLNECYEFDSSFEKAQGKLVLYSD